MVDKQTRLQMVNYSERNSESSSTVQNFRPSKGNSLDKNYAELCNLNEISEEGLSSDFKQNIYSHAILESENIASHLSSKAKQNAPDNPFPESKQNFSNNPLPESKNALNISLPKSKQSAQNQSICEGSLHKNTLSDNASISPQKSGIAVKAGHPEFLSEFYNHSRLHHISTAGQELKRYVQYLVENNKEKYFPGREKLRELYQQKLNSENSSRITSETCNGIKNKVQHVIMHLDMDCFFVSVGLKKHPELRGVPVAVTHSKGKRGGPQDGSDINYEASYYANESERKLGGLISSNNKASKSANEKPKISMYSNEYGSLSEIASCSYEARKAGVRNGMFLGEALRRCPNLKTIPYDFEGYSEVSKQLYNIVASYTLDIEAVSCDELYIDCTELLQDIQLSPCQFASVLRAEIEKETGCTASAGMGGNMLLARLANKAAKPNGQHYVNESDVEEFMKNQNVGDLPGVGYTFTKKLQNLNVKTCEDLKAWTSAKLQQEFGPKTGLTLFNRCRGKDDRTVQCHKIRKSVSAEINYGIRFETEDEVYNFISELSTEVQNRVQNIGCKGKSVTLKLMVRKSDAPVETAKFMGHGVCDHFSKSVMLKSATDSSQIISKECCNIICSLKIKPQDYRGIGIQLSKLENVESKRNGLKGVFNSSNNESPDADMSKNGIFSPKKLKLVNKPLPEKSTIKHYLSNKHSSPSKLSNNSLENALEQGTSFKKQLETPSKSTGENKTIKDFLSKKTPTKEKSNDLRNFLPEEIDQSVLEALPEDLRKEILESYKGMTIQKNKNSGIANSTPHTSSSTSTVLKNKDSYQNLDESVLNALPEDLRREVLASYAGMCKKDYSTTYTAPQATSLPSTSKQKSFSSTSLESMQIPSTSSIPSISRQIQRPQNSEDLKKESLESYKGMTIKKNKNSGTANSTPHTSSSLMIEQHQLSDTSTVLKNKDSYQNLDESFLNALPEDLRREVLASYAGMCKKDYSATTYTAPQTTSLPSTSKQKPSSSTSLESKQVPSTSSIPSISRQIQQPKKSGTELNKASATKIMTSNKPSTSLAPIHNLEEILSYYSLPEDVRMEVLKKYAPSTSDESMKMEPNLGGAVKLDDIRNMLKEWIKSTEDELYDNGANDKKGELVCFQDDEIKNMCATQVKSMPRQVKKVFSAKGRHELKLIGATAHEGLKRGLLWPPQYT
ncbi:DNA repair protein REV1 [Trichonephila clavipes]|nr:DNA repair protein REV1 [Trichonephila clavipes]